MKVFIPKHIKGGLFNMNLEIGPFSISMVQLFIIAGGVSVALAFWNALTRQGVDKITAFIIISPVLVLTFFIAFFKFSELNLLQFIAKMLRTYFFDATEKFQVNFKRVDPLEVKIKKIQVSEKKDVIKTKSFDLPKDNFDKLQSKF